MKREVIQSILSRYLLELGTTLYLLIDGRGIVLETNRFTYNLVGRDIIGRPYSEILIDFTQTLSPFELALQEKGAHLVNVSIATGLPQTFYCHFYSLEETVLVLGSADFSEQETLRREIILLNQELSNLARQLQKSNAELTRLDRLKNQFIGMAAHDLRKPLGVVMAYSEILLDEMNHTLSDEHRQFLKSMMDASVFMRRLIENFLDVSLIESGHFELTLVKTHLFQVVEQALEIVRHVARRKDIEIKVTHDPRIPLLLIDSPKVEQVIVNLVANAIEHSYPGSPVTVRTVLDDAGARILVEDKGTGIPEEILGELFSIYGRGHGRKTAGERSTGLGLAIARKVIEQHAGFISVQSELGSGSTFTVTLPLPAKERAD